jgi:hypothetical protein
MTEIKERNIRYTILLNVGTKYAPLGTPIYTVSKWTISDWTRKNMTFNIKSLVFGLYI